MLVHITHRHARKDIRNISIVGLPGSGKSEVHKWFMDQKEIIREKKGELILPLDISNTNSILRHAAYDANDGCHHLKRGRYLLAVSGAAQHEGRIMEYLKGISMVVFLSANLETIAKRNGVHKLKELEAAEPSEMMGLMKDVYLSRRKLYNSHCDAILDVDSLSSAQVAERVMSLF